MTTTYRTDWIDPADRNSIKVSYHGPDLGGARAVARSRSRIAGSAYVIRAVNGVDDAQLIYVEGSPCRHGWDVG